MLFALRALHKVHPAFSDIRSHMHTHTHNTHTQPAHKAGILHRPLAPAITV